MLWMIATGGALIGLVLVYVHDKYSATAPSMQKISAGSCYYSLWAQSSSLLSFSPPDQDSAQQSFSLPVRTPLFSEWIVGAQKDDEELFWLTEAQSLLVIPCSEGLPNPLETINPFSLHTSRSADGRLNIFKDATLPLCPSFYLGDTDDKIPIYFTAQRGSNVLIVGQPSDKFQEYLSQHPFASESCTEYSVRDLPLGLLENSASSPWDVCIDTTGHLLFLGENPSKQGNTPHILSLAFNPR